MRLRWVRRLFFAVLGLGGLAASACDMPPQVSALDSLDSLHYVIRTYAPVQYGQQCQQLSFTNAVIGVPKALNITGNVLPDVNVQVLAVPGVGGAPSTLRMDVTKLTNQPLKALVEVILNPSADDSRVAFGYDGCESGAPQSFGATITSSATTMTLDTTIKQPSSALTLLGAAFTNGLNNERVDPTALTARLSPVPEKLGAVVNFLPNDAYSAAITPSSPTNVDVGFTQIDGPRSMVMSGTLKTLQGKLDFDFSPSVIHYKTGQPFTKVKVQLDTYTPAAGATPGTTDHLGIDLTDVPPEAGVIRTGKAIEFTTPAGKIGSTIVHYSSKEDGGAALGTLTIPNAPEYVAGNIRVGSLNAQARIRGLSHAIIDTGDPVVVDVTHDAGVLLMDVSHTSECDDCADGAALVTRHLNVGVRNIPATARVTYSPATGDYTYTGGAVIGELTADLTSTEPLVDDADESHLRLVGVPTGLVGRVNTTTKTFTAHLPAGAITTTEVQLTSEAVEDPDDRLPDDVDGVMLHDHENEYVVFLRISGLSDATVGWADTQYATVTHAAGPFVMEVATDDTDSDSTPMTVNGRITDLPATAHVSYTPARKFRLFPRRTARPMTFVYTGSELINELRVDAVAGEPLNDDTGVTTVRVLAKRVPGMTLVQNDLTGTTTANTDDGTNIGYLQVEACSPNGCQPIIPLHGDLATVGDPDLVTVSDRNNDAYDVFALVRGLSSLSATVTRTPTDDLDSAVVALTHQAGPFEVHTIADKVDTRVFDPPLGDPITITTPYVETADVIAHNLPASVNLSYSGTQQRFNYLNASGPIGDLDINYSKGVVPIAARAHNLHVHLRDVHPGVDLRYNFGDDGDSLVLDTGAAKIGHAAIDLLSDKTLVDKPALNDRRIFAEGYDGLVFWDLDDGSDQQDGINDPYVLSGRITNLQHLDYTSNVITHGGSDNVDNRTVDVHRQGGGPDIQVEIWQMNIGKAYEELEGFPNWYRIEETYLTYESPPEKLGFSFKKRLGENINKQYWVDAWGSETRGHVWFDTDAGALKFLRVNLGPIPAGTLGDPGIAACIAPTSMNCGERNLPSPYHSGQLSAKVAVKAPVQVDLDLSEGATRATVFANISQFVEFSKETSHDGANSSVIFLDTQGSPVDGQVRIFDDGDLDTVLKVPKNTRAIERYVEVENEGVNNSRNRGQLMCPYGFDAHTWALGFELSLNDDLCSRSVLTSVANNVIPADGQPHTIDLYGWSMVQDTVDSGGTHHDGTRVFISPSPSGFPAAPLPNPVWLSVDHIQATITIPVGTEPGEFYFVLQNPTGESRTSQETPAACTCKLIVV